MFFQDHLKAGAAKMFHHLRAGTKSFRVNAEHAIALDVFQENATDEWDDDSDPA
jgi:hypothetical protein